MSAHKTRHNFRSVSTESIYKGMNLECTWPHPCPILLKPGDKVLKTWLHLCPTPDGAAGGSGLHWSARTLRGAGITRGMWKLQGRAGPTRWCHDLTGAAIPASSRTSAPQTLPIWGVLFWVAVWAFLCFVFGVFFPEINLRNYFLQICYPALRRCILFIKKQCNQEGENEK